MATSTDAGDDMSLKPAPNVLSRVCTRLGQVYQTWLDKSVPHIATRWIGTLLFGIIYSIRVYYLEGFYIVTYALGIFYLNIFIQFLSPKIDPAFERDFDDDEDGPTLPTDQKEEFRPFVRRMPEFKFWLAGTKAILVAMICTCFQMLDIPVFWPILVLYFIMLFFVTMKRQIKHMIRYKYIPWANWGKTKYQGKDDTGDVVSST